MSRAGLPASRARAQHPPMMPPDPLRDAMSAARALLGWELAVRDADGAELHARIVETEAYTQDDPASHSASGRTPRNAACTGASTW